MLSITRAAVELVSLVPPCPHFPQHQPRLLQQGRAPCAIWGCDHSMGTPRGALGWQDTPRSCGAGQGGAWARKRRLRMAVCPTERRPPQPEPAQVLRARGERQGRRVDRGRARVPKAKATKDDRVGAPSPPRDTASELSPGWKCSALHPLCFLSPCRSPTLVKNMISGLGYGALNASYQVRTQPCSWQGHRDNKSSTVLLSTGVLHLIRK